MPRLLADEIREYGVLHVIGSAFGTAVIMLLVLPELGPDSNLFVVVPALIGLSLLGELLIAMPVVLAARALGFRGKMR